MTPMQFIESIAQEDRLAKYVYQAFRNGDISEEKAVLEFMKGKVAESSHYYNELLEAKMNNPIPPVIVADGVKYTFHPK